jgi:hypothetical protein
MNKQELYNKVEDLDKFCLGIRKYVALNEVIYLIKQLDEPQKVTVPQFVADWIEYCKEHNFTLLGCLYPVDELGMSLSEGFKGDTKKCVRWCRKESNTFAKAWVNGYEVMEEKHYRIKITKTGQYLYKNGKDLFFSSYSRPEYNPRLVFTKEELEQENSDWVFDCPGIEIEEVE